jgi:hypothetical protein
MTERSATKILLLGGSGVLGRSTLRHLRNHEVVATTRTPEKLDALADLGVRAALCDILDKRALAALMRDERPEIVANFLTDLAGGDFCANARIRSEGGPTVVAAATAVGVRRIVVESIAWGTHDPLLQAFENCALQSSLEAVILRFGLFWGPATWYETEPDGDLPHIHIDEAGRRAAESILESAAGIYDLISTTVETHATSSYSA